MSLTIAAQMSSTSTSMNVSVSGGAGSVQLQVADHYNQIKQKTRQERQKSDILGIRRYNNWVKSVLIHRFAATNAVVLDLCCGKGGDLNKFVKAHVRYYVGADHASKSLEDAVERYNELDPLPFPATLICADCHSVPLSKELPPDLPLFDLVSCQFALHYSFETESRARMFTRNIGERLKPGGYFVATFPNSNVLQLRLKQTLEQQQREREMKQRLAQTSLSSESKEDLTATPLKLEYGNTVYNVRFTSPCPLVDHIPSNSTTSSTAATSSLESSSSLPPLPPLPPSPFGVQYTFDLTEAISDCPEYLVHLPTLCSLLAEYDMELVQSSSLHQFFVEHCSHPEYARLLKQMKVLGNEYERNINQDEWEAIGVYMAVVFRRRLVDEVPGSYVDLALHRHAPSTAAFHYPVPLVAPCALATPTNSSEGSFNSTNHHQPEHLEKKDIRTVKAD